MTLHTTTPPEDFRSLFENPRRRAIWIHVSGSEQREEYERITLEHEGWRILPGAPEFFFLAAHFDLGRADAERLLDLVRPCQEEEDVRWMGEIFGYNEEDIAWYIAASGLS